MKPRCRWSVKFLWAVLPLMAATAFPYASAADGSFERTLKVTGPVELDVSTGAGHIDVSPGDSSTVRIRATIRASSRGHFGDDEAERKVRYLESNPPIEQSGNYIHIGHILDRELTRNVSISYELVVPAETQLRSHTGSGSESISGLRGPVKAGTGSGSLRIEDIGDELDAETGSGNVQVRAVKGHLRASTGSGSIRAAAIGGGFVATTGSGDITLEETSPGDGKVETGSGTVELHGVKGELRVTTGSGGIRVDGEPTGEWRLNTGSGPITVRVPSGAAFEVDAHTSSGRISTVHPVTAQGTFGRGELRGRVGQGGFRLELRTGSGNIQIE
ncbi:MAG: hypothetical protein DMG24_03450 [Acidobacteria bacterium]|nr:MAG: hypothetical protein DMG24_03450 [Acidobacteriota bacterium]